MPGNITVAVSQANITVDQQNTTVAVTSTPSTVVVGESRTTSNADIRNAISNAFPITYNTTSGVIGIDPSAISGGNVVFGGNASGTFGLDKSTGAFFEYDVIGDITGITMSNFNAGETATIIFSQDAIGSHQIDTTTTPSNWGNWYFASGSSKLDETPTNWSAMSIFGLGPTGGAANSFYASIVTETTSDTLTNLTVVGNITAGNVSATTFTGNVTGTVSDISNHDTDDLSEGLTNQYFTQTRARTSINTSTNSASGGGALAYNSGSGTLIYTPPDLTAFGLTNAQAQAYIQSNGLTMTSAISSDSNITTTANTSAVHGTFTGAQSITATGNVSIGGNLTVTGNIDSETVRDLLVEDRNITLGYGTTGAPSSNSQILIDRGSSANTYLKWDEGSDKWKFSNDGSTEFVLPESTTDVAEGTNQYYTDARSRGAVSVTTASSSGEGALSYNNTTGVFTFTPADLSAGISNAQAQAFIQSSGLTMTAAISSNSLISTTGNLDLNISTAVDNLYGVRFDSATNKFISSPSIASETPTHFITIEKESTDLELIRSRIARSGANGTRLLFEKSEGTLASPSALGTYDTVWETEYSGWDGAKYENSFGTHVFQDTQTASVSADTVPLAYEFYAKPSGDTTSFDKSIMSLHSDGKIVFNDAGGTRGFNDKIGTANISADGSIGSAANITATGNIEGGNLIAVNNFIGPGSGITGMTTGQVAEGTNLYFTTDRANNAISAYTGAITNINSLSTTGNISGGNISTTGELNVTGTGGIRTSTSGNVVVGKQLHVGGLGLQFKDTSGNDVISVIGGGNVTIQTNVSMGAGRIFDINNGNLDLGSGTIISNKGNTSDTPVIEVLNNQNAEMEVIKVTSTDNTGTGISNWKRSTGDSVTPTAITGNDYVHRNNYFGHDGTDFLNTFASGVYQDSDAGSVSTGVVPLAYEITTRPGGNTSLGNASIIRFDSNRNIIFNDDGIQTSGSGTGNASISADGTFKTLGNLQVNADTDVSGLSGLTFDSATNNLGLGTPTPKAALHIRGTSNETQIFMTEYNGTSSAGPDIRTFRAGGSEASPTVTPKSDRIFARNHYAYDGTGTSGDGISTGFQNAFTEQIITDPTIDHASEVVPVFHQYYTYLDGDATASTPHALMRMRSNGDIQFSIADAFDYTDPANAVIKNDGTITTTSGVTATGNVTGNYILGNGSLLTGITAGGSTDSFGTAIVSGQTNIQASQANAQIEFVAGSGISLTTAGNALTISGSGGSYGNTEVENFLGSNTMTGDVIYQGNLQLSSANVSTAITDYQGNATTGTGDTIQVASYPGWFNGQYVTFSGTTNAALTFLNGNTYQVAGSGTAWTLYTNYKSFTKLETATGTELPTGLTTDHRNADNTSATFYGNVFIDSNSALHTNTIKPFVENGTFSMTGLRASDVALGQNGNNFFWPDTGGNTYNGGILSSNGDGTGTWQSGLRPISESSVNAIESKIYRDGSNGTALDFYKAGGDISTPTAPGSNDYIMQMDQFCHDGTDFQTAAGYHVYIDGDSGSVSTNVTPVSHEFYVKKDQTAFAKSVMKLTADQTIIFNDTGTRSFGDYKGTANISADGSFHTAGDVTIDGRLKLPNYTTTEINALGTPAAGDVVFNTTLALICFYNGTGWRKINDAAM